MKFKLWTLIELMLFTSSLMALGTSSPAGAMAAILFVLLSIFALPIVVLVGTLICEKEVQGHLQFNEKPWLAFLLRIWLYSIISAVLFCSGLWLLS